MFWELRLYCEINDTLEKAFSSFPLYFRKTSHEKMIESVKLRRQCMLDFYSHYEHLCALQNSVPLKAVKANLTQGALDLIVDRIKAADWAPLLNAIRHNKTLTSIGIRSFHQQGLGESGL